MTDINSINNIIRFFACISLIIGAVECFAGFKIMKVMMAIWGFIIGAVIGVIVGIAAGDTTLGFVVIIIFGVLLAVLSFKLYLAGIFILTTFLTTVALYIIFNSIYASLLIAIIVGLLAIFFVKPVVIITTAISGAGIILSSAYIMMDLNVNESPVVTTVLWIPIAIVGIVVQYITTQKIKGDILGVKRTSKSYNPSLTFSERKYPGMQRAYRNFCIKCGYELFKESKKCPRCGYDYDD